MKLSLYRWMGISMLLIASAIFIAPNVPNTVPVEIRNALGIHPYIFVLMFAIPGILMWLPRLTSFQFGMLLLPLMLYSLLSAFSVVIRGTNYFVPAVLYGTCYFVVRDLALREVVDNDV